MRHRQSLKRKRPRQLMHKTVTGTHGCRHNRWHSRRKHRASLPSCETHTRLPTYITYLGKSVHRLPPPARWHLGQNHTGRCCSQHSWCATSRVRAVGVAAQACRASSPPSAPLTRPAAPRHQEPGPPQSAANGARVHAAPDDDSPVASLRRRGAADGKQSGAGKETRRTSPPSTARASPKCRVPNCKNSLAQYTMYNQRLRCVLYTRTSVGDLWDFHCGSHRAQLTRPHLPGYAPRTSKQTRSCSRASHTGSARSACPPNTRT